MKNELQNTRYKKHFCFSWLKKFSNFRYALILPLISVGFFCLTKYSEAATYYVRTDGNNNCSGLIDQSGSSGSCAWQTLQHAADTVQAGDSVLVGNGTYQGFMIQSHGTVGQPIIFQAQSTGANITTHNPTTNDGINIESWSGEPADYVTIDGFNVYNQPRMGVRAIGGTGIIVQNVTAHDNDDCGIFTGDTPNFSVLNTLTYNNGSTAFQHNIYISNADSDNPIIKNNIAYSSGAGNGIQLNGDWQEGGDGFIDNAVIENNIVHNNAAKGFSLISIRNATIRNNITYGNDGAGGVHLVDQLSSHYSTGNTVVNNTLDEAGTACVRINDGNSNNVVFNNICIGSTGIVDEGGSGNYFSNNFLSTNITGLFSNYSAHNYHLIQDSPAIAYGIISYQGKSAPSVDFDLVSRGSSIDAGAYEYANQIPDTTAPTRPSGLSVN